jgi:hypothetical protein
VCFMVPGRLQLCCAFDRKEVRSTVKLCTLGWGQSDLPCVAKRFGASFPPQFFFSFMFRVQQLKDPCPQPTKWPHAQGF